MKKIDSWLDIQRYVMGAVQQPIVMHEDVEFIARITFLPKRRVRGLRRRLRRFA